MRGLLAAICFVIGFLTIAFSIMMGFAEWDYAYWTLALGVIIFNAGFLILRKKPGCFIPVLVVISLVLVSLIM